MITGNRNRPLGQFLCGLVLWCLGSTPGWAVDITMAQVFAALATVPEQEVGFVEERIDQLLGIPLQSRGVLHYRAPDYLAREIHQGGQGRYVIDGDTLIVEQRGRQREMALDSHPALAGLSTLLRVVLAGDLAGLQHHYQLTWQSEGDQWELGLRPREASLSRWLSEAQIAGDGAQILRLAIDEAGGDRIITRLLPGDDQ